MVLSRMEDNLQLHTPVLLNEVIDHLAIKSDGIYIDATFGRGGHAAAILNQLSPKGMLLVMDKDPEAIAFAQHYFQNESRLKFKQGSFSKLKQFVEEEKLVGQIDGILFDLGVSSPQLDEPERGFSFLREGRLDMRMDPTQGEDATHLIATISKKELAFIIHKYGEDRFANRIAHAIVEAREIKPIETTTQLAKIICAAVPSSLREIGKNPATRTFQAIRIVVNQELEDLKEGLKQSIDLLKKGGRLLVISFHSLEDRIVKRFIQEEVRGDRFPAKLPIKHAELQPRLKSLGPPILPHSQETFKNPRSRSAILRMAEKI